MYVTNADSLPPEKIFKTNGVVANWLMTEKNIPLLSSKNGEFIFANTDLLQEVIEEMPFYLKVLIKLF